MTNYDLEKTQSFIDFAKACVEFDKRPKNEKMYFATNYGHFDEDGGKWFINKTIAKNSFYEGDLLALYCMGADTNNQERIRKMLKCEKNTFALDEYWAKIKGQYMNNTNILDTWFGHKNTWFFKKYKIKTFGSPHNWAVFCIKLAEINGGLESIASLLSFFDFKMNREQNEILKISDEIKATLREMPVEKFEKVIANFSIEIDDAVFPEEETEVQDGN